jgi:Nif-specific regulatory protein
MIWETEYVEDAKLVDISMVGIGFTTKGRLSMGQNLRVSIHFKRVHLDLEATVIRSFSSNMKKDAGLLYGAEFLQEEADDVKRFVEQYVSSFSNDRIRDSMIQMSLTDHYSNATEGLEMFALLMSLFNDMTNFAEREGFVDTVLEEVTGILEAQRATVYLVTPDSNELESFYVWWG